jgi:ppGpp synthetase/RelA/SpoT-type nucleotidyltranferase
VTRSQIDKLGERLRATDTTDELPLEQLQAFRAEFDAPLGRAHELVASTLGIEPTARIKTVNTIVEKLRRAKTRLSKMQDIAGIRVVLGSDLSSQNAAVKRLAAVFRVERVDDLRSDPHHGYRAVHVIATVDGLAVEIQLRTKLQDLWAQGMEKLADKAGRGIRYGDVPAIGHGGGVDVSGIVRNLLHASDMVRNIEQATVRLATIRAQLGMLAGRAEDADQRQQIEERTLELAELSRDIAAVTEALVHGLTAFVGLLDEL